MTPGPRVSTSLGSRIERWFADPRIAYPAILLLQLKSVWGMWSERDLTSGDTAAYFIDAWSWYENGSNIIGWSPLYTTYLGSFLHLSEDAHVATLAHRLVLIFVLAVLVLAWMRRMLPPTVAWLIAAWWVILPVNFDTLYEVHLFSVVPVMAGGWMIVSGAAPWRRGAALAILVLCALLVRNELAIATALVAAFLAVSEMLALRQMGLRSWLGGRIAAYAMPMLAAAALVAFFYSRSTVKIDGLPVLFAGKHVTNVCQIYAFGYLQRHSDWQGSPWTDCNQLMQRDFGTPGPTMREAFARNPRAMLEHFYWNLSLIPNGAQVLLFDATSGKINPDYATIWTEARYVLPLTIALLALLVAGVALLWRERHFWWSFWLRDRVWGWIYLFAIDATAFVVMITQRPRPSYLLAFGLSLTTAAGMALFVLLRRTGILPFGAAAGAILVATLAPSYSARYGTVIGTETRGLLRAYRRLEPFRPLFERKGVVFVSPYGAYELCSYLGHRRLHGCRAFGIEALAGDVPERVANDLGVKGFYADAGVEESWRLAQRIARRGWKVVGGGPDWVLLWREPE